MVSALLATSDLFGRLACQTAERKGYRYPQEAWDYARVLLETAKSTEPQKGMLPDRMGD